MLHEAEAQKKSIDQIKSKEKKENKKKEHDRSLIGIRKRKTRNQKIKAIRNHKTKANQKIKMQTMKIKMRTNMEVSPVSSSASSNTISHRRLQRVPSSLPSDSKPPSI